MQNKIEKLKTFVGEPYRQFDEEGNYIGCFAPLYHIWGDSPRYPLPESESSYFDVAFLCLLENFEVVFASEDCGFYELLPRFGSASASLIPPVKSEILNGGIVQLAKRGVEPCFDSASASLIPLDVVVFRLLYGVLHVGIYLGENRLLHVQRGGTAEIVRFSRLSHRVVAVLRK